MGVQQAPRLSEISKIQHHKGKALCRGRNSTLLKVFNAMTNPTNAVAELTVAQMLNMVRRVPYVMNELRDGAWYRHIGRELKNLQVGLIGFGRIGKRVHDLLQPFTSDIKLNDIDLSQYGSNVGYAVTKDEIYSTCDIISLHVPLDESTLDMVGADELAMMKPNACLLNMSRGGIVNEAAALAHVRSHRDFMLAIDTFTTEPYTGKLLRQFNVLPTPHLGSCSLASRKDMEVGAAENVLNMLF